MPFFRQKKQTNKQTKTKLNINRDINNTRIYQYHGLGPLQRQKYPKSEQFQPNHSLGDFQQFCQKKSPRNVDIAPILWQRVFSFFPHSSIYIIRSCGGKTKKYVRLRLPQNVFEPNLSLGDFQQFCRILGVWLWADLTLVPEVRLRFLTKVTWWELNFWSF